MTLTLLSLLFTVPAIHRDVHPRNLCIYHPEISFNFIWTFKLEDNLIELSWINNGFITFIDWDNYSTLDQPVGNIQIPECLSGTFINTAIKGHFKADHEGLKLLYRSLMSHLKSQIDHKLQVRIVRTCESPYFTTEKHFGGFLQVYPSKLYTDKITQICSNCKKIISTLMDSFISKNFKIPDFDEEEDATTTSSDDEMNKIILKILDYIRHQQFLRIPSDTGLVLLTNNNNLSLVAVSDIPPGVKITSIPYTRYSNIIPNDTDDIIRFGDSLVVPIKKNNPFCWFRFIR